MFEKDKGDNILSFAAFFQTAVLMLQELLVVSNIVSHESFRNVSILLSALPMVLAFYYIIKRRSILFIFTYILILLVTLSTLIFFPDNEQYLMKGAFYLFFVNAPSFLCLASIRDINNLKKNLIGSGRCFTVA